MTNRQRVRRRLLIAQLVEGTLEPDGVASDEAVIADAKRRRANHVGLWLAYHRGLQGSDHLYAIPRSRARW